MVRDADNRRPHPNRPSRQFPLSEGLAVEPTPLREGALAPFLSFFLGGVAAFRAGERIGAVGVSGLPGDVDESLAIAGIRAAGLGAPS